MLADPQIFQKFKEKKKNYGVVKLFLINKQDLWNVFFLDRDFATCQYMPIYDNIC